YYKIVDPSADTRKRLIVARILLIILGAAGAFVASLKLTSILGAVAWAFDFAASGLFFPLVLGVWWKRANTQGAIAGMALGFLAGTAYLVNIQWLGGEVWFGIDHLRFAIIGMPVSLIAMVVVSLMTPEPDAETQRMVDDMRIPKGDTVLSASH
ncbi:MAG: cation acetate symporter, partial [Alphaproteobacteria bacterium]|nr:cation acetate symporter [Alphaproteobacteria bacterium]